MNEQYFHENFAKVYESAKLNHRDNKWSMSIMLPEHVALLREYNSHKNDIDKPILDEQAFEQLDENIHFAMEEARSVRFTYYENKKIVEYIGDIHFLNVMTKTVSIAEHNYGKMVLNINNILDVQLLDKIGYLE